MTNLEMNNEHITYIHVSINIVIISLGTKSYSLANVQSCTF